MFPPPVRRPRGLSAECCSRPRHCEKKINCQPHYTYTKTNGEKASALVDIGARITDVSNKWVMERVTGGSVRTILEASGMPTLPSLIFSYNMIAKRSRA